MIKLKNKLNHHSWGPSDSLLMTAFAGAGQENHLNSYMSGLNCFMGLSAARPPSEPGPSPKDCQLFYETQGKYCEEYK